MIHKQLYRPSVAVHLTTAFVLNFRKSTHRRPSLLPTTRAARPSGRVVMSSAGALHVRAETAKMAHRIRQSPPTPSAMGTRHGHCGRRGRSHGRRRLKTKEKPTRAVCRGLPPEEEVEALAAGSAMAAPRRDGKCPSRQVFVHVSRFLGPLRCINKRLRTDGSAWMSARVGTTTGVPR